MVLVIDSSEELVTMLSQALQQAGFLASLCSRTQIRTGAVDLDAFVRQHRPTVITYDLAPPYEADYALLRHIRTFPAVASCRFVLTSPNVFQLRGLLASEDEARVLEIIGKPHDIGEYVGAVLQAAQAGPKN